MSVSEFPGRLVGTPIEPPSALPEGSFLAFDPPGRRVKFIACECVSKERRVRRIKRPNNGTARDGKPVEPRRR